MTAPRDPDQLIRAFLDEGRTELPDRAYDAVRDQIDRTRQRVVIGPWRESDMNTYAKVALAAAAVLVVAVIGINLLPGGSGGVGGAPATARRHRSGVASHGVPASPSPTPSSNERESADVGTQLSGTYRVAEPFAGAVHDHASRQQLDTSEPGRGGVRSPGSSAVLGVYVPEGTYADPCLADARRSRCRPPSTGSSCLRRHDRLHDRVRRPTSRSMATPASRSSSRTGSPDDAAAASGPTGCRSSPTSSDPPQGAATNPGATEYLWVIDVDGTPIVIATGHAAQTFDELDPMVQSIDFDD